MFETISKGFRAARERLTGKGELTEDVVDAALKDVRLSLLEADVEFRTVKKFLRAVKERALGEQVQLVAKGKDNKKVRVRAEDHFVQICHDALVELMGPVDTTLARASKGITGIMMVGLQGSGKTTTTGKLARKLQRDGHSVMLVAADVYRPAAIHQLQVLGERLGVPVFARPGANPVDICRDATQEAAAKSVDFVIYDTAGRLTIDDTLMAELENIESSVHPANIFLVIDAMIGQDAVTTAKAFDERLNLTGVILTKLDGDARGGAALSIKAATGKPIKFLGMGENLDKLEEFRPEGLAGRILGMGDLVGLMHDFQEVVDEEKATADAEKMLGGGFGMDDFLAQIKTLQSMGSMKDLMAKMPMGQLFGGDIPDEVLEQAADDGELVKIEAMINSMTRRERQDPELFLQESARSSTPAHAKLTRRNKRPRKPKSPDQLAPEDFVVSRLQRVAGGCGHQPDDVLALVSRFMVMRDMFGMLGDLMGGGGGGLLGKIPGLKQAKQLNAVRKLAKDPQAMQALMGGGGMPGGMPGIPGMPGGAGGLGGGAGMPDLASLFGDAGGGSKRPKDKAKDKGKRKKEKSARRKNRRK
ncbi:Signal recognition particle, subunit Ffh SRP54 [Enhygromyxa salina]|uniref:signal-recognition-particle GTPase n=1 Tax=Enhygromyxa salina TaxID=215803 RepID=A0A0C1Z335_9BACT|nr:signal recognition particle receptor subunit alpha [Enhygromyxa salina]KIG11989.1 Signal recognition particle, subunit Ffh SRP54 [Enhygromyxa salina]